MFVPVLAAIIRDSSQQILLAQRRPDLANGGLWEFPGGKLHRDERPAEGLKREIREELGVDIEVMRPFHIVNFNEGHRSILLLVFEAKLVNDHFQLSDHSEIAWVSPGELLNYPLTPPDIEVARLLSSHLTGIRR